MNQVIERNAFGNQNDSLKNKKGVNDLMHVLLKQIQMLTTFDKYNLPLSLYIYIYLEIYY
jgi:glutamine amidotransferase PdxT